LVRGEEKQHNDERMRGKRSRPHTIWSTFARTRGGVAKNTVAFRGKGGGTEGKKKGEKGVVCCESHGGRA